MGKTRVRLKGAKKGKQWQKGKSSSSNPQTKKHRSAARGKFWSHLSAAQHSSSAPLTTKALAEHDNAAKEKDSFDSDSYAETLATSSSAVTSCSVYSLVETAHPVFGQVRKFWKTPSERHQDVLATLAAVSEAVKVENGKETEVEYFSSLLTVLEASVEEEEASPVAYLLNMVVPKVPESVLQSKFGFILKVVIQSLSKFSETDDFELLRSLIGVLVTVLLLQDSTACWRDFFTKSVVNTLMIHCIHPNPKVRKRAKDGVVSLLREGCLTSTSDSLTFHPAAPAIAKFIQQQVESGSVGEKLTVFLMKLLEGCLANFPTQLLKELCELILKQMTLTSSTLRLNGMETFMALFTSVCGPQGLTDQLNGQLISALYDHQPSLADAVLLVRWIKMMAAGLISLRKLSPSMCLQHLGKFCPNCINCFQAQKAMVGETAASTMKTLVVECISPLMEKTEYSQACISTLCTIFKSLETGLKYKYQKSWILVFEVIKAFYREFGSRKDCQEFMKESLISLCDLRESDDAQLIPYLEGTLAVAIETMGPRVVLETVSLEMNFDHPPFDFPRSWILPLLREHIRRTELSYFVTSVLPLINQAFQKGQEFQQCDKSLEAKFFSTVEKQLWETLPGFCTHPTDVSESFKQIAQQLGKVLNERPDLRMVVYHSLKNVIDTSVHDETSTKALSRFSKNYLPILFNLYTSDACTNKEHIHACVQAFASITENTLLQTFFAKMVSMLKQDSTASDTKCLMMDLVLILVEHLPPECLQQTYDLFVPQIHSVLPTVQKKAYKMVDFILSSKEGIFYKFAQQHCIEIQDSLVKALNSVTAASRKPRLSCLMKMVSRCSNGSGETFLYAILPEVLLALKDTNKKTRTEAKKLIVEMCHSLQRCLDVTVEEAVPLFFSRVLAGLAGSPRLTAATLKALSVLVLKFSDLLRGQLVSDLMNSVCLLLSAQSNEVVREAIRCSKAIIRVIPQHDLVDHLEDFVQRLLDQKGGAKIHHRKQAQYIIEKLLKKFGYENIKNVALEGQVKFIKQCYRMMERAKKQKLQDKKQNEAESPVSRLKTQPYTLDDYLYDSDDESGEDSDDMSPVEKGAWIREENDEPLDLMDSRSAQKVLSTNPRAIQISKKKHSKEFKTSEDGRILIDAKSEDRQERVLGKSASMEMDTGNSLINDSEEEINCTETSSYRAGGSGIHRNTKKGHKINFGEEYASKKARGDVRRKGKPDPFAYIPLNRQSLNKRKRAKLSGQYKHLMKSAGKGSRAGIKAKRLLRKKKK